LKLIIQQNRIAGTATDDYTGPAQFVTAPPDFDIERLGEYTVTDGTPTLPLPGIPQSVTMRQARLALLEAGLLASVETAIATLPSPQKEAAAIEWEYAQEVQRSSGLVPQMAAALGMTDADLDALFVHAATL